MKIRVSQLSSVEFKANFVFGCVAFLMYLWATVCLAHEEKPSVLDFELDHNSISIKIQMDLKVLFNGGLEDIDLSYQLRENSVNEIVSKNLSRLDIINLVFANWPSIKSNLLFVVDDGPLELELSNVIPELSNAVGHGIQTLLYIHALIPVGSTFLTLGWNKKLGDLVVRQQGNLEDLYTEYLYTGMKTAKIQLH